MRTSHLPIDSWRSQPVYFALCGQLVTAASLEETDGPNECAYEFTPTSMAYCPDCVRTAIGQNGRAGVDAGGMTAVDGRAGGGLGEEVLLLILTRVREGRIWRRYSSEYLDGGRTVWAHVARALDGMLECDHLRLGEVGPDGLQRRVGLAERGLANYTELYERARLRGQDGIARPSLDTGRVVHQLQQLRDLVPGPADGDG